MSDIRHLPKNSTTVRAQHSPYENRLSYIRPALSAAYRLAPSLAEAWVARQFLTPMRYPWPEIEQKWRANAEQSELSTSGLPSAEWNHQRIRVYRWGEGQRGKIALLHGWSGRATQFHAFIAPFVAAGFQLFAVDAPGHGDSDGQQSSIFHFVNALEAMISLSGPVDAVIGHSMGGGVALHGMAHGLPARKAVLIAPNADLLLYSRMVARNLGLNEAKRRSLQQRIERLFDVSWDSIEGVRQAPNIAQPALIIHDQDDKEIPLAMGRAIAGSWPDSRLIITEGLGHRRILADRQVVAAALDFIRA